MRWVVLGRRQTRKPERNLPDRYRGTDLFVSNLRSGGAQRRSVQLTGTRR